MTLEELISNHPETYAEGLREGFASGTAREHARVCALLDTGEAQGSVPLAVRMILAGASVEEARPEFLAERMHWNGPSISA